MNTDNTDNALKAIAKGAGIVFIGLVISKLLNYVFRWLIASRMGPEYYGVFSMAFAIISVICVATACGIPSGVMKFVSDYIHAKKLDKARRVVKDAYLISIVIAVIVAVAVFLLSNKIAALVGISEVGLLFSLFW